MERTRLVPKSENAKLKKKTLFLEKELGTRNYTKKNSCKSI